MDRFLERKTGELAFRLYKYKEFPSKVQSSLRKEFNAKIVAKNIEFILDPKLFENNFSEEV